MSERKTSPIDGVVAELRDLALKHDIKLLTVKEGQSWPEAADFVAFARQEFKPGELTMFTCTKARSDIKTAFTYDLARKLSLELMEAAPAPQQS